MKENKKIYYFFFPLIIISMIALLLFLGSNVRHNSYLNFQKQLAQKSVTGASNELHVYVSELRRSVKLFAAQEQSLIRSLSLNPTDLSQYQHLKNKVNRHFPEHFSFTIASKPGESLLDGLDTLVGKGCKRDIAKFSEDTRSHRIYVHSSPLNNPYHFDVMVPWGNKEGVFFISFNLNNITQILKNSETIGHSLLLLKNDSQRAVELTSKGSTKLLEQQGELDWFSEQGVMSMKNHFQLSQKNSVSIEYETVVNGTLWTLVDIPDSNLYLKHHQQIHIQHAGVFVLFCIVLCVMSYFLFQANKKLLIVMNNLHIANNQKDKLFSIIGHDLRSPFSPIKLFSKSLIKKAKELPPEEISRRANIICDASDRVLGLLEQLLEWASLQNDGYPIVIKPVGVKDIAMKTVNLYTLAASEKNCTLHYETENIDVQADVNALDTIIRNLVSNAIKFTENGSITIGASVDNDKVKIYVKDTGLGMDESICQKIFDEALFHSTMGTGGEKGTGLGLSLCKDLALKQNGKMSVESILGEGSSFYITLQS